MLEGFMSWCRGQHMLAEMRQLERVTDRMTTVAVPTSACDPKFIRTDRYLHMQQAVNWWGPSLTQIAMACQVIRTARDAGVPLFVSKAGPFDVSQEYDGMLQFEFAAQTPAQVHLDWLRKHVDFVCAQRGVTHMRLQVHSWSVSMLDASAVKRANHPDYRMWNVTPWKALKLVKGQYVGSSTNGDY